MSALVVSDASAVRAATPWRPLIDAIGAILADGDAQAPARHVHDLDMPDTATGSLLLMPAWTAGEVIGVKAVTYLPSNAGSDVPTVNAVYLLFDGSDGRPAAVLDGAELTARRTAAISALAADTLARPDARRLLIVGTGELAPRFAEAYATIRDLDAIEIWGRRETAARVVAEQLVAIGLPAAAVADRRAAVRRAGIVACVTGSSDPLVHGADLRPGTHLDLVGSFLPDMREADDEAIRRGSLFVDTIAGAIRAGDLAQPIADGVISEASILAELRDIVTGAHPGRSSSDEITVFKSAGFALADLAAARLAWDGAAGH